MNVLIFGASGATGKQLVTQALSRGWSVTAFVRDPKRMEDSHPALCVIKGDVSDAPAVGAAISGHDAVISALGVGTPLKHDPKVIDGVQHIVNAMRSGGVERLIYLSFLGLPDSRASVGPILRFASRYPLRHEVADHVAKEGIITDSPLQWTIVRACKLTNARFTGNYRSGEAITTRSFLPTVSRADVADAMLKQLSDGRSVRKVVRVM